MRESITMSRTQFHKAFVYPLNKLTLNKEVPSSESSKNLLNHFTKIGIKNATLLPHHMDSHAKNYVWGLKKNPHV